jgi:hypothetical protein
MSVPHSRKSREGSTLNVPPRRSGGEWGDWNQYPCIVYAFAHAQHVTAVRNRIMKYYVYEWMGG